MDGENALCHSVCVDEGTVAFVRDRMPHDETLMDLADLFRVLGDYTRVRILFALSVSELCVCDLAEIIGMSQSAISHQLRVLRSSKIVRFRREGKKVFYSLDDSHVHTLLSEGGDHVTECR